MKNAPALLRDASDLVVGDDSVTLRIGNLELNLLRDEAIDQIVAGHLMTSALATAVPART